MAKVLQNLSVIFKELHPRAYDRIRVDAIDEYSDKLFTVIKKLAVNCKLNFNIDDLHNLEIIIKGLAEEMKEQK